MAQPTNILTFLGTGTSVGVPMVGCECDVCTSDDPRNHRYRSSVLITTPEGNILIDTTPELRLQMLREKVKLIHAVLYTHYHADHLFGLDDLRPFAKYLDRPVPLFCTSEVERKIRQAFPYAFQQDSIKAPINTYLPKLSFQRISEDPFQVLGQTITPIPLIHNHFEVYGFRIGNVAYCTDVSEIPRESWQLLQDLDVLVLDALRYKPHPAHLSLDQALDIASQLKPKQAYFTHMSHEIDYNHVSERLPDNVNLAYDGLRIAFPS